MTELAICLEQSVKWPNKFQMKKKEQFILTVMDMNKPSLPRRRKAPKRFQIGHGEPEFPTSVLICTDNVIRRHLISS